MAESAVTPRSTASNPVRRRRIRRAVFAIAGLALAGLVGVSLLPEPIAVDVVRARRGDLRVTVDEDGITRVKDRYVVSAPLAGSLARIELRAGDEIHEGDVIARILASAPPLLDVRTRAELSARIAATSAGIRQAESAVARARAASEVAARELERSRTLSTQGALPAQQLERLEAEARARLEELASAEFGVRIARHEQTMAQAAGGTRVVSTTDAAPYEVRSPISGKVLRILRSSDGPIAPGTQLVEIGDPAALEIVVDVLTRDAVRIPSGAHVGIDRWGGDEQLDARVRLVEPSAFSRVSALGVEEQRVDVVVDLVTPHARWRSLGDGYRVEASIVVDESRGVVLVPELATFRIDGSFAVYEVVDGVARLRRLRVGRRNGLDVEVISGLRENAVVILHPSDRVRDGASVDASRGGR